MPARRWQAIADDLRHRLMEGEWGPGDRIPPQRELMARYGTTSPGTMVRAIGQLIDEGLLFSDPHAPTTGVRVRRHNPARHDLIRGIEVESHRAFSGYKGNEGIFEAAIGDRDIAVSGISYEWLPADPLNAGKLGVEPGTQLLRRTFPWYLDDAPHQVSQSYMTAEIARQARLTDPGCERKGRGTIAQLLDVGIVVSRCDIDIESRMPTAEESSRLQLMRGVPVFVLRQVLYADGRAVETSVATPPADRTVWTLSVQLRKD